MGKKKGRSLRDAKRAARLTTTSAKRPLKRAAGKRVLPVAARKGVFSIRIMPVFLPEQNYKRYRPNNFVY